MAEQYLVPQFIDVEDKILGPITVRQFLILMVTGLILFIAYQLADFTLFLIEAIVIVLLASIVAFYKVNGMPFHFFLLNFIQTFQKPKMRVWDKTYIPPKFKVKKLESKETTEEKPAPKSLPPSKLSELSLIVNSGGVYRGEDLPVDEIDDFPNIEEK